MRNLFLSWGLVFAYFKWWVDVWSGRWVSANRGWPVSLYLDCHCRVFKDLRTKTPLHDGCDYYLFKDGMLLDWNEKTSQIGGTWSINLSHLKFTTLFNFYWLKLQLALIQGRFGESTDHICGICVRLRRNEGKVGLVFLLYLWTRSCFSALVQKSFFLYFFFVYFQEFIVFGLGEEGIRIFSFEKYTIFWLLRSNITGLQPKRSKLFTKLIVFGGLLNFFWLLRATCGLFSSLTQFILPLSLFP